MDQSPTGRPSVGSNWVPMKTNCVSLITGWTVALATVLVQLLLGQAFGAELQIPPSARREGSVKPSTAPKVTARSIGWHSP